MKNNKQIISPIGLKGKEIHERQLSLMGIKPINESENKGNHAVELTKIGPDGNAYAIIRENHEYYIKRTDKTTGLMLEDFKYIGGLQNKKNEAYPSYAKAIKQLNLKFKSLAEAYNRGGDINVFEDDNLLEHHTGMKADQALSATKGVGDNTEYIVDKKGTPLSNKAKVGKEKGQFGDNLADGKACDDCEEVKVNEGFAGYGFTNESNLEEELNEYEQAIEEMMARYDESDDLYEKFPDLTGDGEVTKADILKGRGVFEGDDDLDENLNSNLKMEGTTHSVKIYNILPDEEATVEFSYYPYDEINYMNYEEFNKKFPGAIEDWTSRDNEEALGEESIEEAIKRLDALLEGEIKKKALK